MRRWCHPVPLALVIAGFWLVTHSACRRHEPPMLVAKNLGSDDRPLLPTILTKYDDAIRTGRSTPIRAADVPEELPEEAVEDSEST